MKAAYRRVLVKLSGERLAGDGGFGISPTAIGGLARDVRDVHELGIQVCLVIGGGNVIRGIQAAHGLPGITSAIASVFAAFFAKTTVYKTRCSFYKFVIYKFIFFSIGGAL